MTNRVIYGTIIMKLIDMYLKKNRFNYRGVIE